MERVLGWEWKTANADGHKRRAPIVVYDIPLLSSLECQLKKSYVLNEVVSFHYCYMQKLILLHHSIDPQSS